MMVSRGDYPQMTLFQVSELLQFAHIYIYPLFCFLESSRNHVWDTLRSPEAEKILG